MSKTSQILTEIRREHGLTQKELAQKLQISPSTVRNWETSQRLPTLAQVIIISEVLEIPYEIVITPMIDDIKAKTA